MHSKPITSGDTDPDQLTLLFSLHVKVKCSSIKKSDLWFQSKFSSSWLIFMKKLLFDAHQVLDWRKKQKKRKYFEVVQKCSSKPKFTKSSNHSKAASTFHFLSNYQPTSKTQLYNIRLFLSWLESCFGLLKLSSQKTFRGIMVLHCTKRKLHYKIWSPGPSKSKVIKIQKKGGGRVNSNEVMFCKQFLLSVFSNKRTRNETGCCASFKT